MEKAWQVQRGQFSLCTSGKHQAADVGNSTHRGKRTLKKRGRGLRAVTP